MNNRKPVFIALATLVILLIIGFGAWHFRSQRLAEIASYDECAAAGYPILETYPEQCRLPDGRTFTRLIENGNGNTTPLPNPISNPPSDQTVATAAFNTPLTLHVGDKFVFPDGMTVSLTALNDSRCKPGVQCIWQGEIGAVFAVSRAGDAPEELRLGTVRNKSASFAGHTFTLKSATTESATIVVSGGSPAAAGSSGSLSGYIHTGPTCPVERIPPDPACADRPYADATVAIKNNASGALTTAVSDASGTFRATLAPGTYTLEVTSASRFPICGSTEASVISGQVAKVDIGCDSGIR